MAPRASRRTHSVRDVSISAETLQEDLLAFLQNPASYPHRPDRVEIVQTHASYVALVPPYVYKVKKPVNLGFLDFSTLEKRRHFCREEVRLNRRLCRDTYLGVVSLSRKNGTLVFGDGDRVVEYAVKMKHLGEGGFLHQRVQRGALEREDLDRVVETLAAFYQAETPTPAMAAWGRVEKLRISTDENFAQTEADLGDLLAPPAFEAIRYYTNRFYDQHALLLERRRAEGHILDGHGDLHLEHIHLTPEAVCIYDCIEFNERLRYVDVANDVAFLAMDLDFNGQPDLARYVACRMAEALDDPALLLLVDFYKCYRAYVRGKVEGMRSREPEVPAAERQASRERARRYYRLALRYAVAGSEPLVVVVMGRVGTGKSTLAHALGEALGWEVLSSDPLRKEQAGVPLYERGSETARTDLYSEERTAATYAALRDGAVARARTHQGAVLDATFGRRRHRDALREALRRGRVFCCFVELDASDATIKSRLKQRETAAQVVSDARLEDFDRLCAHYEAPDALEDARHFTVAAEPSTEATLREALTHLIRLHQ
jgi:aminoglycoside phosphotransferase family enzyme/predicted kinase